MSSHGKLAEAARTQAHWPEDIRMDLEANQYNGCVGSVLVSESNRLRVWHLILPPGKRCPFHRHVLDYFWSCHTSGRARGYFEDGRIVDVDHFPGDTKHFHYERGEYLLHSVQNIGSTELIFTTVEFLQSENNPLPIPEGIKLKNIGISGYPRPGQNNE